MMTSAQLKGFISLTRLDKPIGILLLLWPTYWALWLAAEGMPDWPVLVVFSLGVVLMRSAGCVINDYADRKIDGQVKRTQHRPMTTGLISPKQALGLFFALLIIAFMLVLTMNSLTIGLSFAAVALAACYPFMKRLTHLPQVVLGAAFGWSIPMAFAAQSNELPPVCWLLFAANLAWTVAYDTFYAMVDRDDDIKIGVKSTAILFGRYDRIIIGLLQTTTIYCLVKVGIELNLSFYYYVAITVAALLFVHQQWQTKVFNRAACFKAFLDNNKVGAVIFIGIFTSYV